MSQTTKHNDMAEACRRIDPKFIDWCFITVTVDSNIPFVYIIRRWYMYCQTIYNANIPLFTTNSDEIFIKSNMKVYGTYAYTMVFQFFLLTF